MKARATELESAGKAMLICDERCLRSQCLGMRAAIGAAAKEPTR